MCSRWPRSLRGDARPAAALVLLAALTGGAATWGCGSAEPERPPNVLWIVWDTVRADRLSLYGHNQPTTPFLDDWARGARVFENCVSVAATTSPSHASMFTGLMPSEHRTENQGHRDLAGQFTTVAELLKQRGYQTYLYSANPHICRERGFAQGFDVSEHPWDDKFAAALEIAQRKAYEAEGRRVPEVSPEERQSRAGEKWASGGLAQRGLEAWLASCDANRPFFAFLNYMEAHTPRRPPLSCKQRVMPPEHLSPADGPSLPVWDYTFGLAEASADQLARLDGNYDASLVELDDLFRELLKSLEAGGYLDNTIVIVSSDHGEHLGEHHLINHQYSVYNEVLRVPLAIHYPRRVTAGRDARPVTNMDLFATVLELAGIAPPAGLQTRAVSLLAPPTERVRVAEYRFAPRDFLKYLRKPPPKGWSPAPFFRQLRAVFAGNHKYILGSDGRAELYDVVADSHEQINLLRKRPALAAKLDSALKAAVASFNVLELPHERARPLSKEQRSRLEALGYVGSSEGDSDD